MFPEAVSSNDNAIPILVKDVALEPGGPGKAFVLTGEALFDLALKAEEYVKDINVSGHAGERTIVVRRMHPDGWLKNYYQLGPEKNSQCSVLELGYGT